jgi:phytoene dehydrogenase-like protein
VLVLERRATVGGSVVTSEFTPGFKADVVLHDAGYLSARIASDLELLKHGLTILPAPAALVLQPGGKHLRLDNDITKTAASIGALSAKDAKQWPEFAGRISRIAGFLEALYSAPAPSIDASSSADLLSMLDLGRRLRKLGRTEMVELMRIVPMSVDELLGDWFESDALKGAVGARGITNIMQGPRGGGTAFVLLHHMVGRAPGAFHAPVTAKGGVGEIARALADSARAAGVEIRTGTIVERISMTADRAKGVVLKGGEEIAAKRVVSSADPRQTFLSLCDPSREEPEFVQAVGNIKYKGAWAKVHLALSALPAAASGGETLVVSPDLTYLEKAYDDAKYGRVSARPYLQARVPTVADPSMAPAGKHVMSVHVQYAPYHLREGAWDDRTKAVLAESVVATLGEYLPGFAGTVMSRHVVSPLDLEKEYSLPEGNGYHGELTLDQILFMRPVAGWSRYSAPVKDLFLCGAGTHPGGGIVGGAGFNAARAILKAAKK